MDIDHVSRHLRWNSGGLMTAEDFRARLKAQGLTLRDFTAIAGLDADTASYWGKKRHKRAVQAVPWWVGPVLNIIQRDPSITPADVPDAPRWACLLMAACPSILHLG